jgi:hypothetical protein
MLLQGGKKRVKRSGEREIVYNVYKFMETESEVGITIPLSKVQKRVAFSSVARVKLAQTWHGPHSFQPVVICVICVVLCTVCV